jgi:serine/threonine protein kinase
VKRIGLGGGGGVFEVININTNKRYALKEIPTLKTSTTNSTTNSSSSSTQSRSLESEMVIGKILGKKSAYLVYYEEIFSEGDIEYILMDFFANGDLQTYIGSGKKMKEKVFTIF